MEICDNKYYLERRNRARELMAARGLDALLISHPANRFYLSGFELHDPQPNESAGYLLLGSDGDDWLATDSRYLLEAERLWEKDRIFIYGGKDGRKLRELPPLCGAIIGFEPQSLSVEQLKKLSAGSNSFTPAFIPVSGIVESLREIKEEREIAALKASFALNHKMLNWLRKHIQSKDTLTERELSWEIEKFFRENGAQELAFSNIVAYGPNGAMPHAIPGGTKLKNEGSLIIDAGCRVDNYCSDQTRTWWLGDHPAPEFTKTLRLVQEAQEQAIAMIKPGAICADIYKAANDIFVKAGVEKYFTHGLGHGVGLETHEAPTLSRQSLTKLQAGMVVTVEPGLYYPAWGGERAGNIQRL